MSDNCPECNNEGRCIMGSVYHAGGQRKLIKHMKCEECSRKWMTERVVA